MYASCTNVYVLVMYRYSIYSIAHMCIHMHMWMRTCIYIYTLMYMHIVNIIRIIYIYANTHRENSKKIEQFSVVFHDGIFPSTINYLCGTRGVHLVPQVVQPVWCWWTLAAQPTSCQLQARLWSPRMGRVFRDSVEQAGEYLLIGGDWNMTFIFP